MKTQNRKLLLHDYEDGPRTTTLQPSDPLFSNANTSTSSTTAKPFQPTLGFDSSMALTVLVLLTALFFMVFFSMYLRRFAGDSSSAMELPRRRRQRRSRSSSSSTSSSTGSSFSTCRKGLDPSTVKSLPLFAYDIVKKGGQEPLDCVVCLSEFEVKETVKMIPYCGHVFHQECIDMWFSSHVSCPLCRSTQLFRSTSANKISKNVDQSKGFDDDDQVVIVMERLSSTVQNGDTCVDREREAASSRLISVGRSKSWSRLLLGSDKVSLPRSSSF